MTIPPAHHRSGLVNLVSEIELRLTGTALFDGLGTSLAEAGTYVLVLFDGLGIAQLEHDDATVFRSSLAGTLDAPFPTTTPVSLSTVATGLPASMHGQVAHLSWYPELALVVNTLKWVTLTGEHVPYEYARVLPHPNLWERMRSAGVEPITVQPADFRSSPLTRVLYRGARFEGAWDANDLVDATVALAAEPGRFIFTYVPFVDVAGHVFGQSSEEFSAAMKVAATIWEEITSRLPPNVLLLGTADHGLVEVTERDKILVRDPRFDGLRFAGDTRGVHLWGDPDAIEDLATAVGGDLVDPLAWLGPDPSPKALSHIGERFMLAPPGKAVIPRGFDKRLRCYHGGLMPEEVSIPLLMG